MDGKRSGDKEKTGPNTNAGNTGQQTKTKDITGPRNAATMRAQRTRQLREHIMDAANYMNQGLA